MAAVMSCFVVTAAAATIPAATLASVAAIVRAGATSVAVLPAASCMPRDPCCHRACVITPSRCSLADCPCSRVFRGPRAAEAFSGHPSQPSTDAHFHWLLQPSLRAPSAAASASSSATTRGGGPRCPAAAAAARRKHLPRGAASRRWVAGQFFCVLLTPRQRLHQLGRSARQVRNTLLVAPVARPHLPAHACPPNRTNSAG